MEENKILNRLNLERRLFMMLKTKVVMVNGYPTIVTDSEKSEVKELLLCGTKLSNIDEKANEKYSIPTPKIFDEDSNSKFDHSIIDNLLNCYNDIVLDKGRKMLCKHMQHAFDSMAGFELQFDDLYDNAYSRCIKFVESKKLDECAAYQNLMRKRISVMQEMIKIVRKHNEDMINLNVDVLQSLNVQN